MSNIVSGIVQRRKVGSPTRKAVLMYMASCASDDGSGVWTSKSNMASDLEMGRRTIQVCVDDLLSGGLISKVGDRSCKNGFTAEYKLNIDAISRLGETRAGRAHVQDVHTTRAGRAQQDVQDVHINRPLTIHEPSKVPPVVPQPIPNPVSDEPVPAKPPPKARLPEEWALSDAGWEYARSKKLTDEEITELSDDFRDYWTDQSTRRTERGWEAAWRNRVIDRFSVIIRNRRMAGGQISGGHGQGSGIAGAVARRHFGG